MAWGRQHRALGEPPCREDGFRPGDVPPDTPGKLGDLGAECGHFGGAAAMFQRVVVALWRAALARNGIVPFVRRKIFFRGAQAAVGRPAGELFGLFGRKIFVCARQAALGQPATELFGLSGRKNFVGAAEDAGAGERPRGARLPAEAAMAPRVAVAGRRAAPALRRGYGYRLRGQGHKIPPLPSAADIANTAWQCNARIATILLNTQHTCRPTGIAHAEAAEKIKVAMGRGQPSATDVEGGNYACHNVTRRTRRSVWNRLIRCRRRDAGRRRPRTSRCPNTVTGAIYAPGGQ